MKTSLRRAGVVVGLIVAALWLGACATAPAAHGPRADSGAAYRGGDLHTAVDATPMEVVTAARRALEDLKITLLDAEATEVEGQAVGLTVSGERVVVHAVKETQGPSQVTVRVGALGDETLSRMIYERMRAIW